MIIALGRIAKKMITSGEVSSGKAQRSSKIMIELYSNNSRFEDVNQVLSHILVQLSIKYAAFKQVRWYLAGQHP